MMTAARKNQSGQALIELIVFLPLMFAIYGMISGFASAINGSINQQKVTRAYYYYRIQNNSMVPFAGRGTLSQVSWSRFGMSFVGWMDRLVNNDDPLMPCYKVSIPMTPSAGDTCEEEYTRETTQFIRVGTVYGVCGGTFARDPSGQTFYQVPDWLGSSYRELVDEGSCTIEE